MADTLATSAEAAPLVVTTATSGDGSCDDDSSISSNSEAANNTATNSNSKAANSNANEAPAKKTKAQHDPSLRQGKVRPTIYNWVDRSDSLTLVVLDLLTRCSRS